MDVEHFIARWTGREGGAERANYQMFLSELCDVLGVPRPDPAGATTADNDYLFERAVKRRESESERAASLVERAPRPLCRTQRRSNNESKRLRPAAGL